LLRERDAAAFATRAVSASLFSFDARAVDSGKTPFFLVKTVLGAAATAAGAGTPGTTSTMAPLGISFFVGRMRELDAGATEPVRYLGFVNPELYRVSKSTYSAGDGPPLVPSVVNRSMPLRNALCEPPWRSLGNKEGA
jgi:hypothetical protein